MEGKKSIASKVNKPLSNTRFEYIRITGDFGEGKNYRDYKKVGMDEALRMAERNGLQLSRKDTGIVYSVSLGGEI